MRTREKGACRFSYLPVRSTYACPERERWRGEKYCVCYLFSLQLHWMHAEVNTLVHYRAHVKKDRSCIEARPPFSRR